MDLTPPPLPFLIFLFQMKFGVSRSSDFTKLGNVVKPPHQKKTLETKRRKKKFKTPSPLNDILKCIMIVHFLLGFSRL